MIRDERRETRRTESIKKADNMNKMKVFILLSTVWVPGCGSGLIPLGSNDGNITPSPSVSPFCSGDPEFETYQDAAFVIGQTDFESNAEHSGEAQPVAQGLRDPYGVAAFSPDMLWIPDFGNHRVLGFSPFPDASGAVAQRVIGQSDFSTGLSGTSSVALDSPIGVGVSGSSLYILDNDNHRVLLYPTIPTIDGAAAGTVIVGHPDTNSTRSGCDASSITYTEGFRVTENRLIVADTYHDRVLIWNSIPTTSDVPADLVLGQPNFTTCTATGASTASSTVLDRPSDAATDGIRLVVSDMEHNRVLIWNTFPTSNQQPADVVLGQETMAQSNEDHGGLSARSLDNPLSVELHGSKLIVSDAGNSRVLIWNSIPTVNFAPADVVLGQPNFTTADRTTSRKGLNGAASVRACGNRLYVGQDGAHRYSVFEGI